MLCWEACASDGVELLSAGGAAADCLATTRATRSCHKSGLEYRAVVSSVVYRADETAPAEVCMGHTSPGGGGWLGLTSPEMGADCATLVDRPARATTSRGVGGPWALYLFTAVGNGQVFCTPQGDTGFADLAELGHGVTERPMVDPAGDTLAFALHRPDGVTGRLVCVIRVNGKVVASIVDLHALGLPRGTALCLYASMAFAGQEVALQHVPPSSDEAAAESGALRLCSAAL